MVTKKVHYIWSESSKSHLLRTHFNPCGDGQSMSNAFQRPRSAACSLKKTEVICPSIVEQGTEGEFYWVWNISTAWLSKAWSSLRAVEVLKTELSKLWITINFTQSHCFKTTIHMYITQIKLHGTIHCSSSKTIIWPGQTQHD